MDAQQIQQMQQKLMNMMGTMNPNKVAPFFDPSKVSKQQKDYLAKQTMYQTKAGLYARIPKFTPIVFPYIENYQVGQPMNVCEVSVVFEHILDAVEKYADKGIDYTQTNGFNPVVVNVVGRDFNGSNLEVNEEVRDELINIRTTFNNTVDTKNPFPLGKKECSYLKMVTVIRPKFPNSFLPYPQTYRIALITASPIVTDKLLDDEKMYSADFIGTWMIIECIFQLAIYKQHPILVLPPFGHEQDNNPVEDIIRIYNFCIHKYGHMFKKIIIAIPPHYPKKIFDEYQNTIYKPNEAVVEIDKKYEKEEIKRQVQMQNKKIEITNTPKLVDNEQKVENKNKYSKEQMETMMKMMRNMMENNC